VYPRQWLDKSLQHQRLRFEHHNRGTVGVLSTLPDRRGSVTGITNTDPPSNRAGMWTDRPG
jgi:hypothetical protein